MDDLRQQLADRMRGRVAIVGLGNVDRGDDGLGLHLLERLGEGRARARSDGETVTLIPAATELERRLHELTSGRFDQVLFVDAVDFRAPAGSAALLDREDLRSVLPQVSTHRISLSLAADWVEAGSGARAALLGVQPGSLRPGRALTPEVERTVALLAEWLTAEEGGCAP